MFTLILTIAIVLCVIGTQYHFFSQTKRNIEKLKSFFPEVGALQLKEVFLPTNVLRNSGQLEHFLDTINEEEQSTEDINDDEEEFQVVSLITKCKDYDNPEFDDVISKTNSYLCKNVGTAADYELLKNICEHDIEVLDDQIQNTLNAPLYVGLAGTFIGIIVGLWGVNLNEFLNGNVQSSGLQHLLWGVVAAMVASLCGLGMTVYNTVYSYKESVKENDIAKEKYYDFLRRELMPVLSNSMSSSLSSLKGVLGHFVDRFGRNLDSYADSAQLLNDNLEKQHLVLEEINRLSLTRTASKIAETFLTLKDSADNLEIFKTYQEQLNNTVNQVERVTGHIGEVIQKFEDFNSNLSMVLQNQSVTIDLQQQFKDAIETHFPTGSEGRDVWRKEFDLLVVDSQKVTTTLNDQLVTTTQYISNFIAQNQTFFDTFSQMERILNAMTEQSRIQAQSYTGLQQVMNEFRKDILENHKASIETSKTLKEEIIKLTTERYVDKEREIQQNARLLAAITTLTANINDSKEKASKENNELLKAIKELIKQTK